MKNKLEENTNHVSLSDEPDMELSMPDSVSIGTDYAPEEKSSLIGAASSPADHDQDNYWLSQQSQTLKREAKHNNASASRNTRRANNKLMKRKKFMMGLVGILSLVFIFAMVRAFKPSLFEAGAAQVDTLIEDIDGKIAARNKLSLQWEIPEPYPQQLRDPMSWTAQATPVPIPDPIVIKNDEGVSPVIVISGIVYTEDKPSILVDRQILYEGDEIMGVKILKISRNNVELEKGDKRWTEQVRHGI